MKFSPSIPEVGDKEPSLVALWCIAVALTAIGFLVSRRRRAFLLLLAPLAATWGWAVVQELRDPYVGPAIVEELGRSYVIQAYVALVLPFAFMGLGLCLPAPVRKAEPGAPPNGGLATSSGNSEATEGPPSVS
jgi:hypothetical protein